jgi:putative membrane protein
MKMRLITCAVAAAALVASASLSAQVAGSADETFVKQTAIGGMAEVQAGRLATQKASNAKVKAFGERMVTDHGKANDELKSLAATKKIAISSDIDAEHKAAYDKLQGLSGSAFDRAYVADMITGHEKNVAAFRQESTSGQDPDVKAFASKTLPTIEEHLKILRDLQKEIGARATGN